MRSLERAENYEAAKQLQTFGVQRGILAAPKRRFGFGGVIAVTAGLAAAGAVGYVLWQAFRADDELWVSPEDTN